MPRLARQRHRMPIVRLRVAVPPTERPLLLFDGDCQFCQRWAWRWETAYAVRLAVVPSQAARDQFPEIPSAAYDEALQLIELDGSVYSGANAALRAIAHGRSRRGFLLPIYESVPGAALLMELGYRIVARHRRIFSMLMGS